MILRSPYSKKKTIDILKCQIDQPPSLLRCFVTLNAARYVGTSRVCGVVFDNFFELRNRSDPFFSLRAKCEVIENKNGTTIKIIWIKPNLRFLSVLLFRKYDYDKKTILDFLKKWISAIEVIDD